MRPRIALVAILAAVVATAAPGALHAAPDLTVIPEGNAPASIVIKVNGIEHARCIWNGSTITFSTPDPNCTYDGVAVGQSVRVEAFPPSDAAFEYLACPTTPYGPRGNFCEFIAVTGPPGAFDGRIPAVVKAKFTYASALTVQKTGNGQGTVQSVAPPINCGTVCSATVNNGASVVLTATAAAGSVFTGFTGCTASATNPNQCTLVVSGSAVVKANFALLVPLTVTLAGSGSGSVVSSPPGINCGVAGGVCSASVASDVSIQLTATPTPGSALAGFTGCASVNGNVCTVTPTAATTVTTTFQTAEVLAGVTGWKTTKSGLTRTTRVTIDADEAIDVLITISRNGQVLARRIANGFQPGTRTIAVPIPRGVAGGKATLRVVMTNDAGTSKTQTGKVRIPPR